MVEITEFIQTHSFFWKSEEGLLETSSAQPATFSFAWIRFCLWLQCFSYAFFLAVCTLLPVLIQKLLPNLHDKQKLSVLIYLVTIRKHLTWHHQSSFDSYLLCCGILWRVYFKTQLSAITNSKARTYPSPHQRNSVGKHLPKATPEV